MNCPEHPDTELRQEWGEARTGFCLKCPKHWILCTAVRYMAICQKVAGHEGHHIEESGREWNTGDPGHSGGGDGN